MLKPSDLLGVGIVVSFPNFHQRSGSIIRIIESAQVNFYPEEVGEALQNGTFDVLLEDGTVITTSGENITAWHLIRNA